MTDTEKKVDPFTDLIKSIESALPSDTKMVVCISSKGRFGCHGINVNNDSVCMLGMLDAGTAIVRAGIIDGWLQGKRASELPPEVKEALDGLQKP